MIPVVEVTYWAETPDEAFDAKVKLMLTRWGFDCQKEQMDRQGNKRKLVFTEKGKDYVNRIVPGNEVP